MAEVGLSLFTCAEVSYYGYTYAKIERKGHYQTATAYIKAGMLSGRFVSGLLGQSVAYLNNGDYYALSCFSLASTIKKKITVPSDGFTAVNGFEVATAAGDGNTTGISSEREKLFFSKFPFDRDPRRFDTFLFLFIFCFFFVVTPPLARWLDGRENTRTCTLREEFLPCTGVTFASVWACFLPAVENSAHFHTEEEVYYGEPAADTFSKAAFHDTPNCSEEKDDLKNVSFECWEFTVTTVLEVQSIAPGFTLKFCSGGATASTATPRKNKGWGINRGGTNDGTRGTVSGTNEVQSIALSLISERSKGCQRNGP